MFRQTLDVAGAWLDRGPHELARDLHGDRQCADGGRRLERRFCAARSHWMASIVASAPNFERGPPRWACNAVSRGDQS